MKSVFFLFFTRVEENGLARDAGAVVVHGHDLDGVLVAAREAVKAAGEVRGLAADAAVVTAGRDRILDSTQAGRPRNESRAVAAVHFHRDVCRGTRHCEQRNDNMRSESH